MAASNSATDWKSLLKQLEDKLDYYLVKKAPSIPEEWQKLLVKIIPWLSLVTIVLTLPIILAALGLTAIFAPISYLANTAHGAGLTLSWAFTLVVVALEAIAIPGLFKKAESSWRLLYYATLVGALQNIIGFNLGGLLIGTLLSLYILFQIRRHYK
jgi:hypothetical protein